MEGCILNVSVCVDIAEHGRSALSVVSEVHKRTVEAEATIIDVELQWTGDEADEHIQVTWRDGSASRKRRRR